MNRQLKLSRRAAKLLAEPATLRVFNLVRRDALPVKDISIGLGIELKQGWYLVRKLHACGLLQEVGAKARRGRAQKLYRVASDRFFVSSDMLETTAGVHLSKVMRNGLEAAETCTGESYFFDGDRWRVDKVFASGEQAAFGAYETWAFADLTSKELKALRSEVEAVFERYRGKEPAKGKRMLFHFSCVQTDVL